MVTQSHNSTGLSTGYSVQRKVLCVRRTKAGSHCVRYKTAMRTWVVCRVKIYAFVQGLFVLYTHQKTQTNRCLQNYVFFF